MIALIRNLIVVLALVLGAIFAFVNLQHVHVDLLWTVTEAPLVVLLVAAFLLGFIVALTVVLYNLMRLRSRLSATRRELDDARTEIKHLRSMPIHDA